MATNKTGISWTETCLNSLCGCLECSKGCTHCYAVNWAYRFSKNRNLNRDQRYDGLVREITKQVPDGDKTTEKTVRLFTGKILFNPARLYEILGVREPHLVFVNEFSDLFHSSVPGDVILEHFRVFQFARQHQFQVLTKRSERLSEIDALIRRELGEWPRNVWQGVSVCTPAKVEIDRIRDLGRTAAKLKWISFEPWISDPERPLREAVPDLAEVLRESGIQWTVIGGESGTKQDSRMMTLDDARYLMEASHAAGARGHFKQLGTALALKRGVYSTLGLGKHLAKGGDFSQIPRDLQVRDWPDYTPSAPIGSAAFKKKLDPRAWVKFEPGTARPSASQ